jgi:sigma-B regulation protein RsbU (phosphoserine phosphatase)
MYDRGAALNMILLLRREPGAFKAEQFPQLVWMSNLYGRATHNLVLSGELREAYEAVDYDLRTVADIQRSLLPTTLPNIPTLDIAAHYQTSKRAGGDYYDFFELPGGKWGILLADVSGHGTPAAVLMAVTHSIAHTLHGDPDPPSALLAFINRHLTARYTNDSGKFVTAFYGIYDPSTRTLRYSSAGHCPPRVCRGNGGPFEEMAEGVGLPLGIEPGAAYRDAVARFAPGDTIAFYTDGITEARGDDGNDLFGTDRLDEVLRRCGDRAAGDLIDETLKAVDTFTSGRPPSDDRTLLFVKVK